MKIPESELNELREYQETTSTTAIYPEQHAVSYLTLGLLNEIAEFVNSENAKIATSELGDMMWFVSELANLIGSDLTLLIQNEQDDWHPSMGDAIAAASIVGELAEASGAVAKHLRDGSSYTEEMTLFLQRAVQTIYSIVDVMSGTINPDDPDKAFILLLSDNREKLLSRQKRGVLGGSGNNR
jgi:predicted house-cleaning noncanonical NTP pyrophosphatase (MazG superfamily)